MSDAVTHSKDQGQIKIILKFIILTFYLTCYLEYVEDKLSWS